MHCNAPRRKLLLVLVTSQTKILQTWLAVLCSVVTVAAIARVGVAAALSLSSAVFAASAQAYSSSQTGCFESLLKMHTGPSIFEFAKHVTKGTDVQVQVQVQSRERQWGGCFVLPDGWQCPPL